MTQENPSAWRYADQQGLIVIRDLPDGSQESCLATREDVLAWVKDGNEIGQQEPAS